jgi:two-component sensor histidine kinase
VTGTATVPPGPAPGGAGRLDRLQVKLALLLLLALLPAALWVALQSFLASRAHNDRMATTVRSVATLVSRYEQDLLSVVETSLLALAEDPAVQQGTPTACAEALARQPASARGFANLNRVGADGVIRCAVNARAIGVGVGDRSWFQRLLAGHRELVISEVIIGRVEERPVVALAVPVLEPGAAFDGAVMATIEVDKLGQLTTEATLPEGTTLVLVDRDGRPVIGSSEADPTTAHSLPQPGILLHQLALGRPSFDADGQDGVHRLYAVAPVAADQLNVIIGLPTGGQLAWLDAGVLAGMLTPAALMLAAVGALWIGTQRLVIRHVGALARSARQWSRGELERRPHLDDAPFELRELAAVFGRMVGRIADREAELKTSVAQKEMLLKEVHHRVKNNLQIVASLLSLRAQAIGNPEIRAALRDVQTRIQALALVHRRLYEHDHLATVELADFLAELVELLAAGAAPGDASVQIETDIARLRLPVDVATPLALLVTETVTNALKHAFPSDADGRIVIRLMCDDERAVLTITDDGVGRPEEAPAEGLGLRLCRMVAKQLGGELEIVGPPGTTVRVAFPLRDPAARLGAAAPVGHTRAISADSGEPVH